MRTYTIKDLKIFGVEREQAQDWIGRGFIVPSISKASGKGTINIFNLHDMYRIATFQILISMGISRHQASEMSLRIGCKRDPYQWDETTYSPYLLCTESTIISILIDTHKIIEQVNKNLNI